VNQILEAVDLEIDSEPKDVREPMESLSKLQLMKLLNYVVVSLFRNDKAGTIELLSKIAAEAQVKFEMSMMKFYIRERLKIRNLNLACKLLSRQENLSSSKMSSNGLDNVEILNDPEEEICMSHICDVGSERVNIDETCLS